MARVQFNPRETTDAIFVHCSATKAALDVGVREIRQWHKEQGWLDVGYHYVVRRDGTVEAGREESAVGSHAKGHNSTSVGVCLVGGLADDGSKHEANFTSEQMQSLRTLLTELLEKYEGAALRAHHDVAAKACPSFNLQHWWETDELVTSDRG